MYAYVSHYFFIMLIAFTIMRPYHITFIPGIFIMFFGTYLLIYLSYTFIELTVGLFIPPKKEKDNFKYESLG